MAGLALSDGKDCRKEPGLIDLAQIMPREFKPIRFFGLMAMAAFFVWGLTAFYTHRAAHGRTPEERQAYWIGEKAGEAAPRNAKLATPAELNTVTKMDSTRRIRRNEASCCLPGI